jgi:hypothetical protein
MDLIKMLAGGAPSPSRTPAAETPSTADKVRLEQRYRPSGFRRECEL